VVVVVSHFTAAKKYHQPTCLQKGQRRDQLSSFLQGSRCVTALVASQIAIGGIGQEGRELVTVDSRSQSSSSKQQKQKKKKQQKEAYGARW
jgi:hypothetical protein